MTPTHPNYSLTKAREEGYYDENILSPLPRAVLRPNSFLLLDGEWRFSLDHEDIGLRDNWQTTHAYESTAMWPGSIETHMSQAKGEEDAAAVWHDKIVAWYERDFPRPHLEVGNNLPPSIIQLTLGACGYETRVWLNGTLLRTIEGEEVHLGEYTSFSYELEESMLQDNNRLTVRIADTMDPDTPRGKQESHVYKRGGIWYQTYTGAVRSIWLETVERNRLRSRLGVISVIEDHLVRFNITTRIHDPGTYTVRLTIFPRKGDDQHPLATDSYTMKLEAGEKPQRLVLNFPGGQTWSPEAPQLYRLKAELIDEKDHIAAIETHFGLRRIEARGNRIYLNNHPVYLDGILYQPGTATYEEIERHMHSMKRLGCNLVRIHIAGVDPRIYNLADKLGLMLWVEVPSPHNSSHRSRLAHRDELMRMLALIETHPSVVIWSLYNEDWGAQDIATNAETRQYIIDMYHYLHIQHPQFLVVDNDGWQHISYAGRLKSDLLTAHLYTPDITRWESLLDELVAGKMEGVAAFPLVVGDPFFYRSQVPLIVSEWGGFGFADYGGPKDGDERTDLIMAFKQALRKRAIAGDVYTQATNIEDERNGIIESATGELKVPEGLLNSRRWW